MPRTTEAAVPLAKEARTGQPRFHPLLRLGELLASRRAAAIVPLVGVLFALPSLANGLAFDDLAIRARARGALGDGLSTRLDLFSFFPVDAPSKARLLEEGFLPWFAAPDLHITFLRPLSSAMHLVDYTLLDRWPWLMHAESLALYAGLIFLVAALCRRTLAPGVASLAALLYAVDPGHGMPVGWLANRNAVVATALGVAALIAHDRWRRDRWRAGAWLGPLALVGALLGGESGLGALAYLVAHAVTLDPGSKRERTAALAPYLAIVVGWQALYRVFGYGAQGTGLYVDPFGDPVRFVLDAPVRAFTLLLGQLSVLPAEAATFLSASGQAALAVVGLGLVGYVAWALRGRLRTSRETRFFALGMLLSVVPIVATIPASRLLLFTGIGGAVVIAQVIGDLRAPTSSEALRALRGLSIALHLALAPFLLVATSMSSASVARWAAPFPVDPPAGATIVLLNVPTVLAALPWTSLDPRDDRRMRVLSATTGRVAVTREDARTLLVELAPGAQPDPAMALFRDEAHPLHAGEAYESPGLRAEVLRVDENQKAVSVRYRFARDLDDRSYRWVAWSGAFAKVQLPAVGARVDVGG